MRAFYWGYRKRILSIKAQVKAKDRVNWERTKDLWTVLEHRCICVRLSSTVPRRAVYLHMWFEGKRFTRVLISLICRKLHPWIGITPRSKASGWTNLMHGASSRYITQPEYPNRRSSMTRYGKFEIRGYNCPNNRHKIVPGVCGKRQWKDYASR